VLSQIEKLLSSYYEAKEDAGQMLQALDTTAVPEGESTSVPSMQHVTGMNRRKIDSIEEKERECKRMKVDNAVDGKAGNVAVVLTPAGKERFQNTPGTDLMESVSHEERDLFANNTLENVVHNETLTTDGSEMAGNGWSVTRNMYTDGNPNSYCRFASRETDIMPSAGHSDTSVPETNLNEQREKGDVDSHFHCNEQMLHSSKEHEYGHESTSVAVDSKLTNDGHEVGVQGVDKGGSNVTNTGTVNESDSVTNEMQKTHTYIANSIEKPLQSVLKDVTQGDDLNLFLSSDFDDEIECCLSNNSNTVSVPSDRSSVNQNTGKTAPEKRPCSASDLVSDVLNSSTIPPPASGENVWEDDDFAVAWSKGLLKGSNGKVMQVK
jgi:hypothetical protein